MSSGGEISGIEIGVKIKTAIILPTDYQRAKILEDL